MSIFDHYFGKDFGQFQEYTLPSNKTVKEFGKVYVRKSKDKLKVQVTLLMTPEGQTAEGWQTGVALDASSSMTTVYGRELLGELPKVVAKSYEDKGWIKYQNEDGQRFRIFERAAVEAALKQGFFRYSENKVEPVARKFIAYLARELDIAGQSTVIYWACGNGAQYEEIGDISVEQCDNLNLQGPRQLKLGLSTHLKPAMNYYCQRFKSAQRGMFIFITDGQIDDLDAVKQFSIQLAHEISQGQRNLFKCILIGVGKEVDENQMIALDDLDTGTSIDIWDHKLAEDMRDLVEIFAELVDENQIVAQTANVFDADGQLVKKFTDGLPARIVLEFSPDTPWFELEVMGQRIRQPLL